MNYYNTIESDASDATKAARSVLLHVEHLESLITSGDLEDALKLKAEYDLCFLDGPSEILEKVEELAEWESEFPYDAPFDVRVCMDELEEYRDLGDLEDVRAAVEAAEDREDDTNVADLKAANERLEYEVERQAKLIAKLASALDDIDTIVGAELAGTGGQA